MLADVMKMKLGKQKAERRVKWARVAKSKKKRRNGEPNCLDNKLARVGKSKRWFFSKRLHACRVDATRRRGNDAVSACQTRPREDPLFPRRTVTALVRLQFSAPNGSFGEILLFKLGGMREPLFTLYLHRKVAYT